MRGAGARKSVQDKTLSLVTWHMRSSCDNSCVQELREPRVGTLLRLITQEENSHDSKKCDCDLVLQVFAEHRLYPNTVLGDGDRVANKADNDFAFTRATFSWR